MSGAFESIDVAVIGGGISGLAAAHALAKAGRRFVLLEASPRFGGCIGSVKSGPYIADMGPQSFMAAPVLVELVRDLGLDKKFLTGERSSAKRFIYRHGSLNAVPLSPWQFIATPLLSAGAKWRLLAEPFVRAHDDADEESVASFFERRAGRAVVEALVGPIVSGIYAGDPEKLSVRSTMPSLVQFERQSGSVVRGFLNRKRDGAVEVSRPRINVCSFAGGNQTLVDALAKTLAGAGYRGAQVTRIRQRGAGFALECEGLPEKTIEAARVIVATPAAAAAELIAPLEPGAAEDLRAIEHPPIAQVALAYPRSSVGVTLNGFGFLASRHEGVRILGAVWNSVMFRDRCPEGELLVTAFLGGVTDPGIAGCSDEEVARIAHADLARVMKISETKPKVVAGFRWVNAIPQYALGHEKRLARIAATVGRIPGLALAGNYLRGAGVAECIRQAYTAADKM